jgi:hypothetical protein
VTKSIEQSAIDVNGLISSNSPSISDLSRRNYLIFFKYSYFTSANDSNAIFFNLTKCSNLFVILCYVIYFAFVFYNSNY